MNAVVTTSAWHHIKCAQCAKFFAVEDDPLPALFCPHCGVRLGTGKIEVVRTNTDIRRSDAMESCKQHYLAHFVEDGHDGSGFDGAVIDTFEALKMYPKASASLDGETTAIILRQFKLPDTTVRHACNRLGSHGCNAGGAGWEINGQWFCANHWVVAPRFTR